MSDESASGLRTHPEDAVPLSSPALVCLLEEKWPPSNAADDRSVLIGLTHQENGSTVSNLGVFADAALRDCRQTDEPAGLPAPLDDFELVPAFVHRRARQRERIALT